MPVGGCGAHAIAVPEANTEAATIQHCQGVVSRARHVVLRPNLPIAIGGGIDQHEHALGAVERSVGPPILGAEIHGGLGGDVALLKNGIELARVVLLEEHIVVIQLKARAAALNAPGEGREGAVLYRSWFHRAHGFATQLSGCQCIGVTVEDHDVGWQ